MRRGTTDGQKTRHNLRVSIGPALFAVTVSAIAVVILREAPWPWDPVYYVQIAQVYDSPGEIPLEHRALRWGLLFPLQLMQSLFGHTEAGYYALPIIAVALLALSVFVLSKRVMGPWWASATALVATTNPIVISRSSHPFPDVMATALLTLGVAALLWLDKVDPSRRWLIAVGAGLCFGYAYAAREAVIALAPVVVAILIIMGVPVRYASAALVGSLSVLGLEFFLMNEWFGNPLARIEVLTERNLRIDGPTFPPERIAETEGFQGTLARSLTAWFRRWNMVKGLGLAPIIGASCAVVLSKRSASTSKRFWRAMLAWIVLGWILFVFLGIWRNSRGGFVFNLLQIRYWYVLVPPVALGVVGAAHWLSHRELRLKPINEVVQLKRFMIVATVGICFLLFVGSIGLGVQVAGGFSSMHSFREWLTQSGEEFDIIAASPESGSVASMFTSGSFGDEIWDGEIVQIGSGQSPDLYLVSWHGTDEVSLAVEPGGVDLLIPPANWDIEFVSPSGRLALLTPNNNEGTVRIRPQSGPSMPVDLQISEETQYFWLFPDVGSMPLRFHISFMGSQPHPVCIGHSPTGESFAVPAAYSNIALSFSRRVDDFAAFCPASHGASGILISAGGLPGSSVTSIVIIARA